MRQPPPQTYRAARAGADRHGRNRRELDCVAVSRPPYSPAEARDRRRARRARPARRRGNARRPLQAASQGSVSDQQARHYSDGAVRRPQRRCGRTWLYRLDRRVREYRPVALAARQLRRRATHARADDDRSAPRGGSRRAGDRRPAAVRRGQGLDQRARDQLHRPRLRDAAADDRRPFADRRTARPQARRRRPHRQDGCDRRVSRQRHRAWPAAR